MNQAKNKVTKETIYCGECRRTTNHVVLYVSNEKPEQQHDFLWSRTHYFAQCAGCDSYCYAIATETMESWNPDTEEMEPSWKLFPTPVDGRSLMENNDLLPPRVSAIYREVIEVVNANLSLLSAIGLRMLIEAICKERKVAGSNLQNRIDSLKAIGALSTSGADVLHKLRFLGNHAAHEIGIAQPGEILAALEIAESMLKIIYVVPHLAKKVSTGQPLQN